MEPRLPPFCPPPSTSSGLGSLGAARCLTGTPGVSWALPPVVPLPGTGQASREDDVIWATGCHPWTQRSHTTLRSPTGSSVTNDV